MRVPLQRLLLAAIAAGIAGCAGSGGDPPRLYGPAGAVGKTWAWQGTVTPVEKIVAADPSRYTLQLMPNGQAALRADCNRGIGSYEISEGRIKLAPIALTRAMCPPGSQSDRFTRDLQQVTSFFVQGDALYLELPADSGTLRFMPVK